MQKDMISGMIHKLDTRLLHAMGKVHTYQKVKGSSDFQKFIVSELYGPE